MNKIKRLRTFWQSCEKIIAYCALAAVVVLECLNLFAPGFSFNAIELSLGLIASSLLVIFSHIEDLKKDVSKVSSVNVSNRFNDGLLSVFEKNRKIKTIDILAHTTKTYIHSIADNDVTIDKVRILVCKPNDNSTRQYPDEQSINSLDIARDQAIQTWKDLQRIGKLKQLEIKYYEFDPTFYFAIINGQYIHYGLYKLEHDYPGYHLYNMYTLDSLDNEMAYNQMMDYQAFFENIYKNFSYPDSN